MGRSKGSKNLHPKSIAEKFWIKVSKGAEDECWNWIGSRNKQGYGHMGIDGKHWRAARIVWTMTFGDIPTGMLVCHTCDNPSCVNPKHLFLGTLKDNALDMVRKGRGKIPRLRGDDCPWAKTNSEVVTKIRQLYQTGDYTQIELSQQFGMSHRQIGKIVHRERWKHLP